MPRADGRALDMGQLLVGLARREDARQFLELFVQTGRLLFSDHPTVRLTVTERVLLMRLVRTLSDRLVRQLPVENERRGAFLLIEHGVRAMTPVKAIRSATTRRERFKMKAALTWLNALAPVANAAKRHFRKLAQIGPLSRVEIDGYFSGKPRAIQLAKEIGFTWAAEVEGLLDAEPADWATSIVARRAKVHDETLRNANLNARSRRKGKPMKRPHRRQR